MCLREFGQSIFIAIIRFNFALRWIVGGIEQIGGGKLPMVILVPCQLLAGSKKQQDVSSVWALCMTLNQLARNE